MSRFARFAPAATVVLLACCMALTPNAVANDRPVDEIVDDIQNLKFPQRDRERQDDEAYVEQYMKDRAVVLDRRAELTLELFEADADHERLLGLMPWRWQYLRNDDKQAELAEREIAAVLRRDPKSKLAIEAIYFEAGWALSNVGGETETDLAPAGEAIDRFIAAAPEDGRAARLLGRFASAHVAGSPEQVAIYERIKNGYPESTGAKYADGKIRQARGIGKPFELAFTDAITGSTIDMRSLRGQVVVIDYWATWCGPCIAEMPTMKKLYEEFHEDGVEFIGVSLDRSEEEGGLEKLREYV